MVARGILILSLMLAPLAAAAQEKDAGKDAEKPGSKSAAGKSATEKPATKPANSDEKSPEKSSAAKPSSNKPEAETDDVAAKVKRLVRQLDADAAAEREAAEKELIALGAPALLHLPAITPRTPAEVKDRLGRVRRALEESAAVSVTKSSLITLQGELKLSEAFAALEKQTGNALVDFREEFGQQASDPQVRVDFDKVTFWEAFDQLADQAEITPYNYSGQPGKLAYVARTEDDAPRKGRAQYAGLFRAEPLRIETARDFRNSRNNVFQVFIDFGWEPRLQPIVALHDLNSVRAVDDAGNAMATVDSEGEIETSPEVDATSLELVVPLALPDRSVKKIGSIKGKLSLLVPGRIETFEFTDLDKAKAVEQRRANVAVVIDQVRKNQDVQEVRMRVKFDKAANALESHRTWIYNNPAHLIDPEGNQIEPAGMEATLQEDSEVGVAYQFVIDAGIKGYKFAYRTPSSIIKLPVEYEVKDLELP